MIPESDIERYADSLVFSPTTDQAEQALLLRRVMVAVGQHDALQGWLVCSGGTTLHQALLPAPLRHSEDLDLLVARRGPLKPVYDAFYEIGEEVGFSNISVQSRKRFPKVYFEIEYASGERGLLKVEMSQEPASLTMAAAGTVKEVGIDTPWYTGKAEIRCVNPAGRQMRTEHQQRSTMPPPETPSRREMRRRPPQLTERRQQAEAGGQPRHPGAPRPGTPQRG